MVSESPSNAASKYVLCAPRGCGFNDVMCQIWVSYSYALASNRSLLIDTRFSGLADSLDHYMQPLKSHHADSMKVDISFVDEDQAWLDLLSCYPKVFEGRIDILGHHFLSCVLSKANQRAAVLNTTQRLLRKLSYVRKPSPDLPQLRLFPFLTFCAYTMWSSWVPMPLEARSESLVVHHASGGGLESLNSLALFRLEYDVSALIQHRVKALGDDFDAIHIRHTDYQTDYVSLFDKLRIKLKDRTVLICSDNPQVVGYARERLKYSDVQTLASEDTLSLDPHAFVPAHYQWHLPIEQRRCRNYAMLTDLVGMAKAKRLFYGTVKKESHEGVSGFSMLADALRSRPDLLDAWLDV